MKVALLDVEGTITPVSFVHDKLFPLAREALPAFVAANPEDPDVKAVAAAYPDVTQTLLRWMADDRKDTHLKAIQGRIWKQAWESGQVVTHLYAEVPSALAHWAGSGVRVAIYSSGSVEAQQLLLRHTRFGDLTPRISAWFDTTTGPKREARSYRNIQAQLGVPPADICFFSDVEVELDAAAAAGFCTVQIVRPEHPGPGTRHTIRRALLPLQAAGLVGRRASPVATRSQRVTAGAPTRNVSSG